MMLRNAHNKIIRFERFLYRYASFLPEGFNLQGIYVKFSIYFICLKLKNITLFNFITK